MSLLTVVQDACDRIGIDRPSFVIGSTDQKVIELLSFANQSGQELVRQTPWQSLMKETSFSSVAQDSQGQFPSDFDRIIPDTFFDRTARKPIMGPISSTQWQIRKGILNPWTFYYSYRVRGNEILVIPTPPNGNQFYYEYISNQWVKALDNSTKTSYTLDTDVSLIDEKLITLGVRWRWLKAKGLEWMSVFEEYNDNLQKSMAVQEPPATLNMMGNPRNPFVFNVQDGNWPS